MFIHFDGMYKCDRHADRQTLPDDIGSGVGTYLSGTDSSGTAVRPTFWPQTAYCTYDWCIVYCYV